MARNLALTQGLIVAERLSIVLGPVLGKDAVAGLVAAAAGGADLGALSGRTRRRRPTIDVAALLDPAQYVGLAARLVDQTTGLAPTPKEAP